MRSRSAPSRQALAGNNNIRGDDNISSSPTSRVVNDSGGATSSSPTTIRARRRTTEVVDGSAAVTMRYASSDDTALKKMVYESVVAPHRDKAVKAALTLVALWCGVTALTAAGWSTGPPRDLMPPAAAANGGAPMVATTSSAPTAANASSSTTTPTPSSLLGGAGAVATALSMSRFGVWTACGCTAASEGYCSVATLSSSQALAAFNVLAVIALLMATMLFALLSFWPTPMPPWVSMFGLPGSFGVSAALSMATWISAIVMYSSSGVASSGAGRCNAAGGAAVTIPSPTTAPLSASDGGYLLAAGAASMQRLGLTLGFTFGLHVTNTVICVGITVVLVLRAMGRAKGVEAWSLVVATLTSVLCVIASSAEEWVSSPRGVVFGTHDTLAWASLGQSSLCSCRTIADKCSDVQANVSAIAALGIIRALLQLLQLCFVAGMPKWFMGRTTLRLVNAWMATFAYTVTWAIALATLGSCGCRGLLQGQQLSWPFAVEFVGFVAQLAYAALETLRRLEAALLYYLGQQHQGGPPQLTTGDGSAGRGVVVMRQLPPTARPPTTTDGTGDDAPSQRVTAFPTDRASNEPTAEGGGVSAIAPTAYLPRRSSRAAAQ